ncbi:MAG: HAD-IA family hydrolase [Myxococcales bacterium]|nr:HAD-IA family hydrolase [Myxococcales bacterium]
MWVVFDLDGTLVDSRLDIAHATNHALIRHGKSALPVEVISRFVGDGARPLLSRAAGLDEHAPELEALLADFLEFYTAHATDNTRPMPHALSVLELLGEELPLALCTNKPRVTTGRVLAGLRLGGFFRAVAAGDDLPQKKPDPAPLLGLMRRLNARPELTVMVGDGPQDIQCGRSAGARCVALTFGNTPVATLERERPDAVLDDLRALPRLLRKWRAQMG